LISIFRGLTSSKHSSQNEAAQPSGCAVLLLVNLEQIAYFGWETKGGSLMKFGHVCPWWMGNLLASPLRRLGQNPRTILEPHVHAGMTVFEPGPGMGFFTLELARLVGDKGQVIAVDVQPKMLSALARRARKAGLQNRIILREPVGKRMGVDDLIGQCDFVLAFAVVHELPDAASFFQEVSSVLKVKGNCSWPSLRGMLISKVGIKRCNSRKMPVCAKTRISSFVAVTRRFCQKRRSRNEHESIKTRLLGRVFRLYDLAERHGFRTN
jgi:ubiquinone/menaquinone biosynthesis C-methylase UbiE